MQTFHCETTATLEARAEDVFDYLDDHRRIAAHMSDSSWMMAGSRMALELDASQGRAVGAKVRLSGRALGIALAVEEVVTERNPPLSKAWETTGRPQLLVIGPYRMGYQVTPLGASSRLRVFIDYAPPDGPVSRRLGSLFGRTYARWCTRRMAEDAAMHFRKRG
jgi:hypothetical protein